MDVIANLRDGRSKSYKCVLEVKMWREHLHISYIEKTTYQHRIFPVEILADYIVF